MDEWSIARVCHPMGRPRADSETPTFQARSRGKRALGPLSCLLGCRVFANRTQPDGTLEEQPAIPSGGVARGREGWNRQALSEQDQVILLGISKSESQQDIALGMLFPIGEYDSIAHACFIRAEIVKGPRNLPKVHHEASVPGFLIGYPSLIDYGAFRLGGQAEGSPVGQLIQAQAIS